MSTLSATEQALFNIAKASLPRMLFVDGATDFTPELAAFAKQFAPVFALLDLDTQDTFIAVAATEALNQHAKDRGTRRQDGETNEALATRLRFLREDAVTVTALLDRTTQVMASWGVTLTAPYPGIAELRRDRFFYGAGDGLQITCVAAALISDAETFEIDGIIYEFNKTGGVTSGNVAVDISAATTAADVATAIAAALQPRYGALAYQTTSYTVIRRAPGPFSESVSDPGFVMKRKGSYYSRGYRYSGPTRTATVVVIMLPYGTTAEQAASVAEAMRQIKAGGVKVIVERRLNP